MTREELEDIWNNKPYGYFTQLRKKSDLSKYKNYTIEAKVSKVIDTKTLVVRDTKPNGIMIDNARNVLRKQIRDEFGSDVTVSYNIRF